MFSTKPLVASSSSLAFLIRFEYTLPVLWSYTTRDSLLCAQFCRAAERSEVETSFESRLGSVLTSNVSWYPLARIGLIHQKKARLRTPAVSSGDRTALASSSMLDLSWLSTASRKRLITARRALPWPPIWLAGSRLLSAPCVASPRKLAVKNKTIEVDGLMDRLCSRGDNMQ